MQLRSKVFLRFLSDPLGRRAKALELLPDGVVVTAGSVRLIEFEDLVAAPSFTNGYFGAKVHLQRRGQDPVILAGADANLAADFVQAAREAWRNFGRSRLQEHQEKIDHVLISLKELEQPRFYPSAFRLNSLALNAKDLDERVLSKLDPEAIGLDLNTRLEPIRNFVADPTGARVAAVTRFVDAELSRWKNFLDTVESKPLTPEQRLSVVVDEDATLVLAGAGSGKTSVITAKAAYLIRAGLRTPEEILLLAFGRDAAKEMSERITLRCGVAVEARTFHALAYDIIGAVEGAKPALAPHASDDMAFLALLRDILRDLVIRSSEVAQLIIGWFAHVFDDPSSAWDFKTKHEWYAEVERLDLRTLQGEQVASFEELLIANWLYRNGIAYEYEPVYEHPIPGDGKRVYTPDFRLTESGVYLEHFGVRKQRQSDGSIRLITAPVVDRDAYIQGMEWKRALHAKHGTVLVETYSWERSEGRLIEALAKKLAPHVKLKPRPAAEIYDRVSAMGSADVFTSLLGTFLRHFKSGGYGIEGCLDKARRLKLEKPAKAFLAIFGAVLKEYQARLEDRIDFEDMVSRATAHVESGRFSSRYRHILVDEFQDISTGRARLIKALKSQHADARLFAVGDDWQSIYRFAGSDIHVMRNFGQEFGGTFAGEDCVHRTIDLGRTFRSVDKIALAARQFVLRNPAQIVKTVVPAGYAETPALRVVWTRKGKGDAQLREVIANIAAEWDDRTSRPTVLLLGRYRRQAPVMVDLQRQHPSVTISFKTIHASKGLEADHVILLHADSGRGGFPSEIIDHPLLTLVSPEAEPFEHAEERRVMYVAMTRARHTFTMLASEARPSAFVTELTQDASFELSSSQGPQTEAHPCGECGGRLILAASHDGRQSYRCEHVRHCGNRLPACSACGNGLPHRSAGSGEMTCSTCGADHNPCPNCADGWLVSRKGRYGTFQGCVRYPTCTGKERNTTRAR